GDKRPAEIWKNALRSSPPVRGQSTAAVYFSCYYAQPWLTAFLRTPRMGYVKNELPRANLTTMFIGAKWHKGLVWARAALLLCAFVPGTASQGADADPAKPLSVTQGVPHETEVKPLHWSLKPVVRPSIPPGIGRKRQS